MREISKEELYSKCTNSVVDYVSTHQKTQFEIERKIQRTFNTLSKYYNLDGGECEEIEEGIINDLCEQGLIDDKKYVSTYINQKINSKRPYIKMEISRFLSMKGISRETIDEELTIYTDDIEIAGIKTIIRKKNYKDDRKLTKYLTNRGFTYINVKLALDTI